MTTRPCDNCHRRADLFMVNDDLWTTAGLVGWVCFRCLEDVIDRKLVPADFTPGILANTDKCHHEVELRTRMGLPTNNLPADDLLKYGAAITQRRLDWTLDEIGGAMCEHDHDDPIGALLDLGDELKALAARCGNPNLYSDGRVVKSGRWIEDGVYTETVWHPDPTADKVDCWRGNLQHDPGTPCPGIYEVTTYPETQEIHVRVVKVV